MIFVVGSTTSIMTVPVVRDSSLIACMVVDVMELDSM